MVRETVRGVLNFVHDIFAKVYHFTFSERGQKFCKRCNDRPRAPGSEFCTNCLSPWSRS